MKRVYWQGLILLIIIAIEMVGFNKEWLTGLLYFIHPVLPVYISNNLILVKLIIIICLSSGIIILWLLLKKSEKEPLSILFLIKGFQAKGSDLMGIFNILFILISISWLSDELYLKNIQGILNAAIYCGFMFLYPLLVTHWFLPIENKDEEKYKPKVLITAISLFRDQEIELLKKCLAEMDKEEYKDQWLKQVIAEKDGSEKKMNNFIFGPWSKLDPIRKSIIEHAASFEEIHLVASSEVSENIKSWPEELKPDRLIIDFITKFYPGSNCKVYINHDGISGNDMIQTDRGLDILLNDILSRKFKDEDILFNITGGTAAISSAMILKAIPGNRHAEYARQDTGLIEDIPVSIYNIKKLWYELLEKVG